MWEKNLVFDYELHHFSRGVYWSLHTSMHVFHHRRQSVPNTEMKMLTARILSRVRYLHSLMDQSVYV